MLLSIPTRDLAAVADIVQSVLNPGHKSALLLFMSNLVFMQFIVSINLHHFPVGLTEPVVHSFNHIYLHLEGGFKFRVSFQNTCKSLLLSVIYRLKMRSLSPHPDN